MRVITIEGLKGTGKSTLVSRLREASSAFFPMKFPKLRTELQEPFSYYAQEYTNRFTNVSSSLGLNYYSSLFSQISKCQGRDFIILDRGMLSLPFYGYYGYFKNRENLSFKTYENIVRSLYERALHHYQIYEPGSIFFILEADEEIIKGRVGKRKKFADSDRFFLDNFELYLRLKERFENMAKQSLRKSRFIHLRNENVEDQERNLEQITVELG